MSAPLVASTRYSPRRSPMTTRAASEVAPKSVMARPSRPLSVSSLITAGGWFCMTLLHAFVRGACCREHGERRFAARPHFLIDPPERGSRDLIDLPQNLLMDALSELLRAVKLSGALVLQLELFGSRGACRRRSRAPSCRTSARRPRASSSSITSPRARPTCAWATKPRRWPRVTS